MLDLKTAIYLQPLLELNIGVKKISFKISINIFQKALQGIKTVLYLHPLIGY